MPTSSAMGRIWKRSGEAITLVQLAKHYIKWEAQRPRSRIVALAAYGASEITWVCCHIGTTGSISPLTRPYLHSAMKLMPIRQQCRLTRRFNQAAFGVCVWHPAPPQAHTAVPLPWRRRTWEQLCQKKCGHFAMESSRHSSLLTVWVDENSGFLTLGAPYCAWWIIHLCLRCWTKWTWLSQN